MTAPTPCPCCDVVKANLNQIEAMALGYALGKCLPEGKRLSELICGVHRTAYSLACLKATQAIGEAP